jgi:hypothetical protein
MDLQQATDKAVKEVNNFGGYYVVFKYSNKKYMPVRGDIFESCNLCKEYYGKAVVLTVVAWSAMRYRVL